MFVAINQNGEIVDIDEANPRDKYYCRFCNAPMIIKDGEMNAKHFAHVSGFCTDTWNYDISEWHRQMQMFFPKEAREVVVENGNTKHIADVLIDKTVIEIQHSPITAAEFAERNEFFISLGYRIAWIFDVRKQFDNGQLYFSSNDNMYIMTWKHPMRIFSAFERPTEDNDHYAIWLFKGAAEEAIYIEKVISSEENDNGTANFKEIEISEFSIALNYHWEIDDFFISKINRVKREIRRLKKKCDCEVKYSGERGKPQNSYICPRRNEFGIKIYGDYGCNYCRYCGMILEKSNQRGKTKYAVYCCYPVQVNEVQNVEPAYESLDVPMYDI